MIKASATSEGAASKGRQNEMAEQKWCVKIHVVSEPNWKQRTKHLNDGVTAVPSLQDLSSVTRSILRRGLLRGDLRGQVRRQVGTERVDEQRAVDRLGQDTLSASGLEGGHVLLRGGQRNTESSEATRVSTAIRGWHQRLRGRQRANGPKVHCP
jgi:hypothetical protein